MRDRYAVIQTFETLGSDDARMDYDTLEEAAKAADRFREEIAEMVSHMDIDEADLDQRGDYYNPGSNCDEASIWRYAAAVRLDAHPRAKKYGRDGGMVIAMSNAVQIRLVTEFGMESEPLEWHS